jgi:threonine/homoserine/homoserine lactone efflux protein
MFDTPNLSFFLTSTIALTMMPGPDMLYVIARSMGQGRKAGLLSAGGVCVGVLVHVLAAAIGLSALLMTSAWAYRLVKYTGAVYLIYLGIRTVLNQQQQTSLAPLRSRNLITVFYQGILSSTLNPKLALFFLAFLPQFVSPNTGNVMRQILQLGSVVVAIAMIWLTLVALLTSCASVWLKQQTRFNRWQKWLTGGILMGLGLHLAMPEQH